MAAESRFRRASVAYATLLLVASPALADGHLAVQGGVFAPWQGDPGGSVLVQLLGSSGPARSRFGAEFEFRNFDSKIIKVSDVDVQSYILRAVWQQHFAPDSPVTPYVGLGIGLAINRVDDHEVDRVKGRNLRKDTGAGPSAVFMLGIQAKIPGAEYMSFYGEGRLGITYDFTGRNGSSRIDVENLGGGSGSAGIRFRF